MVDNLAGGYEGQGGEPTETATSVSSVSEAQGSEAVVGQASAPVVVDRPAPGQTVSIQAEAGKTYVLNFPAGQAQVQVQGKDFILAFDDNGDGTPDSRIVFLDLVTVAQSGDAPDFQVAGVAIDSSVLLNQALALAGQENVPLDEVAAGQGPLGGGGTYDDNLGSVISLLVGQGVIPPVALQFGTFSVAPDPIFPTGGEVAPPLLINEIGVNVKMLVSSLTGDGQDLGERTVIDDNDSFYGGGEYGEYGGYTDNNGSLETAQAIARSDFGITPDPTVEDDSQPRVEIHGNIDVDNDVDYYSLQLVAGEVLTLDVDFGADSGDSLDSQIFLLDADGNVVASNDDGGTDPGSVSGLDSFLTFVVPANGTYYIAVTSFNNDIEEGGIPTGGGHSTGGYTLQVSIDNYQGDDGQTPFMGNPDFYNFVELANTTAVEVTTSSLTLEVLNLDGTVSSFDVPDGITIPANGYIVFYQQAGDAGLDGVETVFARVFDATGNQVDGFDVSGAPFWGLGEDTTAPIAVNLVFQGSQSLDTFAANVLQADLGGLTDPSFDGVPTGFGSPLLNLEFETFNGQFTGNHHIFSRVNLTDSDTQGDWTTNNVPTDGAINDVVGGPLGSGGGPFNVLYVVDVSGSVGFGPGSVLEDEVLGILALNQSIIAAGLAGQVEVSLILFDHQVEDTVTFSTADGLSSGSSIPALNGLTLAQYFAAMPSFGGGTDFNSPMDAARTLLLDGNHYLGHDNFIFFLSDGFASFNPAAFPEFFDPNNANFINASIRAFGIGAGADLSVLDLVDDGNANGSSIGVDNPDDLEAILGAVGGGNAGSADLNPWDPVNDDLDPRQDNPDPLAGQNFLQAAAGGDLVEGFGGPDFLLGSEGNDSLYGGSQALYLEETQKVFDQLQQLMSEGSEGGVADLPRGPFFSDHNDFLFGDAGDDEMYGGAGGDYLIGGEGNDSMDGGTGDDQIYGDGSPDIGGLPEDDLNHTGNDVIAGDALNNGNVIEGSEGAPIPTASEIVQISLLGSVAAAVLGGNDTIFAGNGNDLISGDALAEHAQQAVAFAYADDSILRPEDGFGETDQGFANDVISAGEGDDLIGGDAAAIVHSDYGDGGEGTFFGFAEAFSFNNAAFAGSDGPVGSDTIDGGEGNAVIGGDALAVTFSVYGGVAEANARNVAVEGGEGFASAGNDLIVGNEYTFGDPGTGIPDIFLGDSDTIGGDAAAVAFGDYGEADATANNIAVAGSDYGSAGPAVAGSDSIAGDSFGEGGEGVFSGSFLSSSDLIGGDAAAAVDGAEGEANADGYNYASVYSVYGSSEAFAGNDYIIGDNLVEGGEGHFVSGSSDIIGGDAAALSEGSEGAAYAYADNQAFSDALQGFGFAGAGNDTIVGDNEVFALPGTVFGGSDTIGGDAAAVSFGDGSHAEAAAYNTAEVDGGEGLAGSDVIYGDNVGEGGEGGFYGGGDMIGGDAAAVADGLFASAYGYVSNSAYGVFATAGADRIDGQDGSDSVAGDALAVGSFATATTYNTAEGGNAGGDYIETGSYGDLFAGESLSIEDGDLIRITSAYAYNTADYGGSAGSDEIFSGDGADIGAGDAAEIAYGGSAHAHTENSATGPSSKAGDDTVYSGSDDDTIAGGSLAVGYYATAETANQASSEGSAGNDRIEDEQGNSIIAGDALAISTGDYGSANAQSDNTASDFGRAGNDTITASDGLHAIAGDGAVLGDGGEGLIFQAFSHNVATGPAAAAGNDVITVGNGSDDLAYTVLVPEEEELLPDSIEGAVIAAAVSGILSFSGSAIAGESLTIADFGLASGTNEAAGEGAEGGAAAYAGNDTIIAGDGGNIIAGEALGMGEHTHAEAHNYVTDFYTFAVVGSDSITAGEGTDLISGDALATGGGTAYVDNTPTYGAPWLDVSQDSIYGGGGDDTLSGDALAVGGLAEVTYGGDDYIDGGGGNDLIAGDALAIGSGSSTSVLVGGDDTLLGGAGDDTIYGDTNDGSEITGGNDVINGGDGNDVMTGGGSIDTFIFDADAAGDNDTVTDFDTGPGGDVLNLSDLLTGESASGAVLATFLHFVDNGSGGTTIQVDPNGTSSFGTTTTIDLQGVGDLTGGGAVTDTQIATDLLNNGNLIVDS